MKALYHVTLARFPLPVHKIPVPLSWLWCFRHQANKGPKGDRTTNYNRLVEIVGVERSQSRAPLIQVMFAYHNFPITELTLPGVSMSLREEKRKATGYDLGLSMHEEAGELRCVLEYNSEIFNRETVDAMREHYGNILQAIIDHPSTPLKELQMIDKTQMEGALGLLDEELSVLDLEGLLMELGGEMGEG